MLKWGMSALALGQMLGTSAAFAEDFDRAAFERDPAGYLATHYASGASSYAADLASIGFQCRQAGLERVCERAVETRDGCAETLRIAAFAGSAPALERARRCRGVLEAPPRKRFSRETYRAAGAMLLVGPDGY